MDDPKPENVVGQKRVVHKVEHRIDWGYVAAGVGLLALAWIGRKWMRESEGDEGVPVSA